METIDARSILADAAREVQLGPSAPRVERRKRLSPAALAVVNEKVAKAYSPIVIAGVVRLIDFVLSATVGISIYLGYVASIDGLGWQYPVTVLGCSAAAVVCFQAADIYQVQVFRGQLKQMTRLISAWALVRWNTASAFLVELVVAISMTGRTSWSARAFTTDGDRVT